VANLNTPSRQDNHLQTFQALCWSRARRWQLGDLELHDAVDWLASYAEHHGLDTDQAQLIMAQAFAAVRDDLDGWRP
jgi:hypothetical protein